MITALDYYCDTIVNLISFDLLFFKELDKHYPPFDFIFQILAQQFKRSSTTILKIIKFKFRAFMIFG